MNLQMLLISDRTYRFRSIIVLKISMKTNLYLQNSYLKFFLILKAKLYVIQSSGFPHDILLSFVYEMRFSSCGPTQIQTTVASSYVLSSNFLRHCELRLLWTQDFFPARESRGITRNVNCTRDKLQL
jgi:hypothetical protein